MSYAIRKDGKGWRAVNGHDDVGSDEVYSETQPETHHVTSDQLCAGELLALAEAYRNASDALKLAWVSALIANTESAESVKSEIEAELADLLTQYRADVASVKSKYPT